MKVLVIAESSGSLIWKSLNRLKPRIIPHICQPDHIGSSLTGPGIYDTLVVSLPAWVKKTASESQRLQASISLLVLYETAETSMKDEIPQEIPCLLFSYSENLAERIASSLTDVAARVPMGQLSWVTRGGAACSDRWTSWSLPEKRRPDFKPQAPVQTLPITPGPASGSVVIHNVTVAGDRVQNKVVFTSNDQQKVELNVQGETHITQHADGDQVNINRLKSESVTSIDQSAGDSQVNINRVNGQAPGTAAGKKCHKCGVEHPSTAIYCDHCGAMFEAK